MAAMAMDRAPDLNLNRLAIPCSDAAREFLKRAMLQHEIVFRHQVRELHRLYWAQRGLMSELCLRTAAQAENVVSDFSNSRKRGFDMQTPADELGEENLEGERLDSGGFVPEKRGLDWNGCSLFGRDISRSQAGPWVPRVASSFDLPTQIHHPASSKPILIDLNTALDEETSEAWYGPLPTIATPSSTAAVVQHGTYDNSLALHGAMTSVWRPSKGQNSEDTTTEVEQDASYLVPNCHMEENTPKLCYGCQDSLVNNLQTSRPIMDASEDVGCCNQLKGDNTDYNFDGGVQDTANRKPLSSSDSFELEHANAALPFNRQVCYVNNDSRRQTSTITSSDDIEDTNLRASVGSTNLPLIVTTDSGDKEQICEGSEEDTLSSHTTTEVEKQQDVCPINVPFVRQCDSVDVNNLCGSEDGCNEEQAVAYITEESGTTESGSLVPEGYPRKQVPVLENFDSSSLKNDRCNIDELKHQVCTEKDSLIFVAAETLLCMSSEKPECPAERHSGFGQRELEAGENEEPQYSSDIFEALTLMLPESRNDEFPAPAISTDEGKVTNACGIRLRRGRGLRDFQKDILPGLVSLSRHEICEDMHNIQHAIRKARSRTRQNWVVPVRSRRTRRCAANTALIYSQVQSPTKKTTIRLK